MSHFPCLVIGPDIETQLQPFHEFECTGRNDQYVQTLDITDDVRNWYAERHGERDDLAHFLGFVSDEYGYSLHDGAGAPLVGPVPPNSPGDFRHRYGYTLPSGRVFRRTNPNKKWDYWTVGGRWSNFFGPGVASLRRGEIDFEGARRKAREKANSDFDKWEACSALQKDRPLAFGDILAACGGDRDHARSIYGDQPAIAAAREFLFGCPIRRYGFDRAAYVAGQEREALVPHATLHDGVWHERGSMGWFGQVADEQPEDQWARQVADLYESLPTNVQLTIVDCHI